MVRDSRDFNVVRAVPSDPGFRRDCLFHLSGLPAGIQARDILRPSCARLADHDTGALDTGQPPLVYDTFLHGRRLDDARQHRSFAAVATRSPDRRRRSRRGGDSHSHPGSPCHAGCFDRFRKFAAVQGGVCHLCARERPHTDLSVSICDWVRRAHGGLRGCHPVSRYTICASQLGAVCLRGGLAEPSAHVPVPGSGATDAPDLCSQLAHLSSRPPITIVRCVRSRRNGRISPAPRYLPDRLCSTFGSSLTCIWRQPSYRAVASEIPLRGCRDCDCSLYSSNPLVFGEVTESTQWRGRGYAARQCDDSVRGAWITGAGCMDRCDANQGRLLLLSSNIVSAVSDRPSARLEIRPLFSRLHLTQSVSGGLRLGDAARLLGGNRSELDKSRPLKSDFSCDAVYHAACNEQV